MQTYVYIDNFRGFKDTFIPLRQVNFLVGENSTGKTSFLELLEILSLPTFWVLEPRYGVPGVVIRHFLDLVSASSVSKKTFTIGAIGVAEDSDIRGMVVTYGNVDGRPSPTRVSRIHGGSFRTVVGKLSNTSKKHKYKSRVYEFAAKNSSHADHQERLRDLISRHNSDVELKERESKKGFELMPFFLRYDEMIFEGFGDQFAKAPYPLVSNFVEFAPIRTKPRRTYDAPQTEFTPEGEHTPYLIKKHLSSKANADKFLTFIEESGESSGLFESIKVKTYGSGPLAPFEMKIVLGKDVLGLDNVGYGVSQALPLLVEMFVRPRQTTFAIQQPEVHLHPKAQATIGDLIAELARSDEKRFVIETHSDFTIDRFRLNVRQQGEISSQILFFERAELGNKVTPIPIQSSGDLGSDQPDNYRAFFYNESLSMLS